MVWTKEQMAQLREEWEAVPRRSTATIARKMGVSKNTVVSKANRMELEPRESPIRPKAVHKAKAIPAGRATLPLLPSLKAGITT